MSQEKQQLLDMIDGLSDEQCRKLAGFIAEALKLM